MNKRRTWFKYVLFLAIILGTGTVWGVHSWLTPGPQLFSINQLLPPEQSIHGHFFDRSCRWLCVHVSGIDGVEYADQKHVVFDLDQNGKRVGEFRLAGSFPFAQQRDGGFRQVHHLVNDNLIVVDQSFVDGKPQHHRLGSYRQESILRVLIAEEGERVIVIYCLPMWPWRALTNIGQPPLMSYVQYDYTCIADVWDVSTGKRVNQIAMPPPNWGDILLSPDGQWLVRLEMESEPEGDLSTLTKAIQVKPAKPRGVQIINTTTGQRRMILEKPYEEESYGAYEGKILGDQLWVFHTKKVKLIGGQSSSIHSSRDTRNRSSILYDLATGQESQWSWPSGYYWSFDNNAPVGIRTPGWLVSQRIAEKPWPTFLATPAKWLNYDLNTKHPLGLQWEVTLYDAQAKEIRSQRAVPMPYLKDFSIENRPTKAESVMVKVYPKEPKDLLIYRWKVPFSTYSVWWSIGAGLLVSTLIVMAYKWLALRRQRLTIP